MGTFCSTVSIYKTYSNLGKYKKMTLLGQWIFHHDVPLYSVHKKET